MSTISRVFFMASLHRGAICRVFCCQSHRFVRHDEGDLGLIRIDLLVFQILDPAAFPGAEDAVPAFGVRVRPDRYHRAADGAFDLISAAVIGRGVGQRKVSTR